MAPIDVGCKHALEAGAIHFDERPDHADTGIVHEYVEVIEYSKQFRVAAENVRLLCDIRVDGMSADRIARGDQVIVVAARNRDLRPGLYQCLCDGEADASRSACH